MSDDLKSLNNEADNNSAVDEAADNNISDTLNVKGTNTGTQKEKKKQAAKKSKKRVHKSINTDNMTKNSTPDSEKAAKQAAEAIVTDANQNTQSPDPQISESDIIQNEAEKNKEADTAQATVTDTLSDTAADADIVKNESDTADADHDDAAFVNKTENKDNTGKNIKPMLYKLLQVVFITGFVIFGYLFIDEVVIQPIRIKNSIDITRDLYKRPTPTITSTIAITPTPAVTNDPEPTLLPPTPTPDPNRDAQGRLLQFADLLAVNDDVKGWITIPDTNIDYVVVQSDKENPELYLDKDIYLEYNKAGTLFIDIHGSVEQKSRNLVIHGHNMVSTAEKMFHDLNKYKVNKAKKNTVPSYYKKHPVINFDTIYQTGQWKIFAVFITNGTNKKEEFFDYTKSWFSSTSDFLNFVYQIRIRSELNIDSVDITDTDQLLMLSTCSYEVDDYRTVIVARKVREGEAPTVDTAAVTVNKNPLYPKSYYYRYGGKAPKLPETFEEALAEGIINWYTPPELVNIKQEQDKNKADNETQETGENKADKQTSGNQKADNPEITQIPEATEAAD